MLLIVSISIVTGEFLGADQPLHRLVEEGEAQDCRTTTEAALAADLSADLQEAWERLREGRGRVLLRLYLAALSGRIVDSVQTTGALRCVVLVVGQGCTRSGGRCGESKG